eukprot:TRINITY_DN19745_c0_g1_i2.p3 TRINITY_DN19745_c0_g1~~TRINITY_DN19745_c0_g1_i2.p3  ORF type:complete len:144 (-),score=15.50 TRINITY_DN19745_c0_g1_i2:81-512(-)
MSCDRGAQPQVVSNAHKAKQEKDADPPDDGSPRQEAGQANEKGGVDLCGRRRSSSGDSTGTGPTTPGPGPRNSLDTPPVGAIPTKADRQKAALERLRNPKKKTDGLSPPRSRTYRDKTSRSRSRDKKKDTMGRRNWVQSGGIC